MKERRVFLSRICRIVMGRLSERGGRETREKLGSKNETEQNSRSKAGTG